MPNLFIAYPKCSTCQNAKQWLIENGIEFEERNIVEETPTVEELKKWFNTSGLKYKELKLSEKLPIMKEEEKIELLASNGMLIKRPLLITPKGILIGFKPREWFQFFEQI